MKFLRRILTAILIVAALLVAIGFLLPRKVTVERSKFINAPQSIVFEQINTLKNWERWSPWHSAGAPIHIAYAGQQAGTGASFTWQSANRSIGNGKLIIVSSYPNDSLSVYISFDGQGSSGSRFQLQKKDSGTLVIWAMQTNLPVSPVSRWFGLLMNKLVGADFEKGLNKLDVLAKSEAHYPFEITRQTLAPRLTISLRDTADTQTINPKLSAMYRQLSRIIKARYLKVTGSPFAVFYKADSGKFDVQAGFPVNKAVGLSGKFICDTTHSVKVVVVKYVGTYKMSHLAYQSAEKYLKDNNLTLIPPVWEEYVTDPVSQPDSTKWQTNIYFPVK